MDIDRRGKGNGKENDRKNEKKKLEKEWWNLESAKKKL